MKPGVYKGDIFKSNLHHVSAAYCYISYRFILLINLKQLIEKNRMTVI